jgi:hypothetical protein
MDEVRVGVLPPFLPSAQRVGYGRILSMLVIVIADRARRGSARRDPMRARIFADTPRRGFKTGQQPWRRLSAPSVPAWAQASTRVGQRAGGLAIDERR